MADEGVPTGGASQLPKKSGNGSTVHLALDDLVECERERHRIAAESARERDERSKAGRAWFEKYHVAFERLTWSMREVEARLRQMGRTFLLNLVE